MIAVDHASFVRPGFARIKLVDLKPNVDSARLLAAAAYRVAATLEDIAIESGRALDVSAAKARLGVVEFSYAEGEHADDIATEIAIDACSANDFLPADLLVELGEIEP